MGGDKRSAKEIIRDKGFSSALDPEFIEYRKRMRDEEYDDDDE